MTGQTPDSNRAAWRITIPALVGLLALGILIGGLGFWSVRTRLAGAIISSGVIEVQSNRQVVQHPEGGVVGEIYVRDGDTVEAGELLVRLDDTFIASELAIVEGQLNELLARKVRLEAERDGAEELTPTEELADMMRESAEVAALFEGQNRLFIARNDTLARETEQLREQIAQTGSQIDGTEAQLQALREQAMLIAEELTDQQSLLEKGLAQASRVTALQREEAGLKGDIGRLEADTARLKGQIAATEIEILRLGSARREEAITTLRDLQFREIELAERRLTLRERLMRLDIRAPVTGVIYGSQIFALQSVVEPAQPMMYVVPRDTPLLIAARVEAIHVDQLYVGQPATLRFPAFDQRETPEIAGQVINISADVFTDDATGISFYRAELLPGEDQVARLGDQVLLPGMPVEALIKTDERTPLSYLTKPLTDYFTKAFRG
ncbi:HlyD family type I secretion periplasmic adaptor subunit [Ruegeria sp. HKCCD8929]|uniref:HlyD family type I secretion periplasmic adaptor subunit n=1 Tax=Ruegeria sp. HKCCD8929 TaxID=2683006 RepID=UPI001487F8B4|nr:HlyD family type I secretion periplasmic adaptor subunit [Ruegeria sp. HKCCD8929]